MSQRLSALRTGLLEPLHLTQWLAALASLLAVGGLPQIGATAVAQESPSAVAAANRPFPLPETTGPTIDKTKFQFVDVGAKIPNYTPGARWGTQGAPLTLMQKPLPAEESILAYQVPKEFQLALWAKEATENWPADAQGDTSLAGLQGKPIAMTWDQRGRLWICETIDYPNELQSASGEGRDRIKICEDTDNDGRADKFTIFAEHLSIPSTLVCYRDGCIIQDGQKTIYMKDVDGDDRADFRQELITGWAMGDTHGGVSNFQYGPDNWIWAMQGYNNSQPVINGQAQMRFRQGFWRFKVRSGASDQTAPVFALDDSGKPTPQPTGQFDQHSIRVDALEFVRATNNNTWGLGFSEEGYIFGSTANGCPSVHMPIANRYYDQVSGWSPKTLERISPTNDFKAVDNEIRQVDYHGGYTAAAGSALYTARNYPEAWWNKVQLVCEPTGHLVGAFVLEKTGANYQSNNTFNALAGIDDWHAPIMAEVGPDGNVWVLDWYNYIVQHNPTPNGFQTGKGAAYESDLRDKRFGRVYRLLHNSSQAPSSALNLHQASPAQLVEALSSDNFFWRRTAQRLLIERNANDPTTLEKLVQLSGQTSVDAIGLNTAAMHAIWTLAGLAESGGQPAKLALAAACRQAFAHPSSPVRNAAISSCPSEQISQGIAAGLLSDIDPRVQLTTLLRVADGAAPAVSAEQLAELAVGERGVGSAAVLQDAVLLDAWTAAASTQAVPTIVALINRSHEVRAQEVQSRALAASVAVLAEHVARNSATPEQIEALLDVNPNSTLTVALWEGLAKGWPRSLTIQISESAQRKFHARFLSDEASVQSKAAILAVADKWSINSLEEVVNKIQDRLLTTVLDNDAQAESRATAWDQAIKLAPQSPPVAAAIDQLFTPQLAPELGVQFLSSLQSTRSAGMAEQLLQVRSKLGPKLSSAILTLLLARAETTEKLLDAIAAGTVRFSDLQLDQRQAILNHPTREIAARARKLMESQGALVTTNRQALVDQWLSVTHASGNLENGLAMYKKHCGLCHKHGEIGVAIGPNLTGVAVHPKEEILVNILDPSRSVENNFRIYQILTTDGVVLNGMLAGESANTLRLINSQGKEVQVLRADIEEMNASPKSLMPEGFESAMTRQEMTDLLTFLSHRDKFLPLALSGAATLSGASGLPGFRGGPNEKFEFPKYGTIEIEGVPFELQDPQDGRVPNIIALQSARGRAPAALPESVELSCTGTISAIHLLAALQTFGPPANRGGGNNSPATASLIVRCKYADGTVVEHPLSNGQHLATYRERVEVPKSKFALDANGKQVRYVRIETDGSKPLKSLEFVKGEDFSLPLIMAVTVE